MAFATTLITAALCAASFAPPVRANHDTADGYTWTLTDGLNCTSFNAPITASAQNLDLSFLGKPANEQAFVQSTIDQNTVNSPLAAQIANASKVGVEGTYSIHFDYCFPTTVAIRPSVLQLIHGLVGNAAYWNNGLEGKDGTLSFVKAAGAAGYATLAYDRLCVGGSDKADGTAVCQIAYEIAQAISISKGLRDGSLKIGNWDSVVGVGHSYGSATMFGAAGADATAFDGSVLTGFTLNSTTGPLGLAGFRASIASTVNASRFSDLPNDYVSTGSVSGDQAGFFHYPNYSNESLQTFTDTKSPYTIGQATSLGAGGGGMPSANYSAPVLVVTGGDDAIFCTGDCSVTSLGSNKTQLDTVRPGYPGVAEADFATFVVPDNGHGINFHENAFVAYKAITDFLLSKNL